MDRMERFDERWQFQSNGVRGYFRQTGMVNLDHPSAIGR
jgi:hypothetical protein